ncbi:MAG: hypothetical protein NDJ94_16270 [Vicinamibacteria bacterium]|nr:hypothetical protein [Vicinamibacteria bacterium]
MDARVAWRADKRLQIVILLVGLHSCALGVGMLTMPRLLLAILGFPESPSVFFPSQSGIFLIICGVFYLAALREPSYVWTIVVSKALAVLFLAGHLVFGGAPPLLWLALAGDFTMGAVVLFLAWSHREAVAR